MLRTSILPLPTKLIILTYANSTKILLTYFGMPQAQYPLRLITRLRSTLSLVGMILLVSPIRQLESPSSSGGLLEVPRHGPLFDIMKTKRAEFKRRKRLCEKNAETLKADRLASKLSCKDFNNFWKDIKKN